MSENTQNEFKNGWPIISAAAIGIGLGMSPLPFYTLGVLAGPIMQEFGWTLSDVYSAFPVYTLVAFFMAPFIGKMADKFGARRIALTSIILFGFAMMAQSLHTGNKTLWLSLWALIAVFGAGTLPITFTRSVNNAFKKHRGKALGIALITTGMFGTLAKYFAQEVIVLYDWRTAYIALGLLPILIAFPLSLLAMRDVSDVRTKDSKLTNFKLLILIPAVIGFSALAWLSIKFILPQIAENGVRLENILVFPFLLLTAIPLIAFIFAKISTDPFTNYNAQEAKTLPGLTFLEAIKGWRIWVLALVFVLVSYSIGAIIPLIEPMLMSKGITKADAVTFAGILGLAVLAGRLIGGALIDKFWAPGVAFIFLASPAIALYILSAPDVSTSNIRIAIFMIGFGAGVEYDFLAYLVSKYFGMRSYSTIYGFLYGFFGLGAGLGPLIMTSKVAKDGSWTPTLITAAIVLVIGSLPLLALGKYRKFEHKTE